MWPVATVRRHRPHGEKRTVERSHALLSLLAESNDLPILEELELRKQVVARARPPGHRGYISALHRRGAEVGVSDPRPPHLVGEVEVGKARIQNPADVAVELSIQPVEGPIGRLGAVVQEVGGLGPSCVSPGKGSPGSAATRTSSTSSRDPSAPTNPRGAYPFPGSHFATPLHAPPKWVHGAYAGRSNSRSSAHGENSVDCIGVIEPHARVRCGRGRRRGAAGRPNQGPWCLPPTLRSRSAPRQCCHCQSRPGLG